MEPIQPSQNKILSIPIAIVVAGALIAGSVIYTNTSTKKITPVADTNESVTKINPITKSDHILGNPAAPIVIVEYSDTECPFCKGFQSTMNKIIDVYGKDGKVAWVYRHLPIENLHPKAWNEAIATECVAQASDNATFWKYLDKIYNITPSNNGLDPQKLYTIAKDMKLDITECLDGKKTDAKVRRDYDDGVQLNDGRPGTPTSVFVLKNPISKEKIKVIENGINSSDSRLAEYITFSSDNQKIIIKGAFPYEAVSLLVQLILQ